MRIIITGNGAKAHDTVEYSLEAETSDFKGRASFYGDPDLFKEFAKQLLDFPFTTKETIVFKDAEGPLQSTVLEAGLLDQKGHISFTVEVRDDLTNYSARFGDRSVEAEELHGLAKSLLNTDFRERNVVEWQTHR